MQDAAQARVEELVSMTASITHAMNSPLAVLHGRTRQLRRLLEAPAFDSARAAEMLDALERMTDRLTELVRSMRSFAADRAAEPVEVVAVAELVRPTIELMRDRFVRHGVELLVTDGPSAQVSCRPSQVTQTLVLLLTRAFDAVKSEGVRWVAVSTTLAGDLVQLHVEDSSAGPSAELVSKVITEGSGLVQAARLAAEGGGRLDYTCERQHPKFSVVLPRVA
jgi:C4-dicarboxylate-specific signal transduction histidine kinase